MGLMWLLNSPLNTDKHFTNAAHNYSPAGPFLITQHTYEHTLCSSPLHIRTYTRSQREIRSKMTSSKGVLCYHRFCKQVCRACTAKNKEKIQALNSDRLGYATHSRHIQVIHWSHWQFMIRCSVSYWAHTSPLRRQWFPNVLVGGVLRCHLKGGLRWWFHATLYVCRSQVEIELYQSVGTQAKNAEQSHALHTHTLR